MSFLVASGHVEVEARTGSAKDEIRDLIRTMGGLSPSAQAAANALKDLGRRADLSGRALGKMADRAQDAERSLTGLRAVAGDIRVTAELNDDTTAGVASVRAAIRDLKAEGPIRLDVTFSGDSTQIVASAQAMRDLRTHARDAGQALATLATRVLAAAVALHELENAAQGASRALRTLRGRAAATAAAMGDLRDTTARAATALRSLTTRADSADGRLNTLSDRSRTLRRDMDDLDGSVRRVGAGMGGLRGRVGSVSSSADGAGDSANNLMVAALSLGSALIPVAAAMVPIAAGAAAAGAGVTAFTVAVISQIKSMSEASEAATKYDKAVEGHGQHSAAAAEAQAAQQRILKKMPAATREAAAALTVLKDEYRDWSDALASDTMPVVTKSLGLFQAMLPRLTPIVRGTSEQIDNMLNVLAGGMQTSGFERFMDKLADWSSGALARATFGMVEFTQALDSGEVSSSVSEFMAYVRENGPIVAETLGNLAKAAVHLIVAASDMGVTVLTVANALAKLVNAVPTEVISTFLQLYTAFKLAKMGAAALTAVTTSQAAAGLSSFVRAARFGGVGSAISGVTQRIGTLGKVAGGLGILGAVAVGIDELATKARGAPPDVDKLVTSLKTLAATGETTGELKNTFGSMDDFIYKLGRMKGEQQALDKGTSWARMAGVGPVLDTIIPRIDSLVGKSGGLEAVKEDFKSFDQAFASMASSGYADQAADGFKRYEEALKGAGYSQKEINQLFPEYTAAVAGVKAEQDLAAAGMGLFGQQAIDTTSKLNEQKSAADGLRQAIVALNDVNRANLGGMIGFEASIDAAAKAAKDNANSLKMVNGELDLNSPKAQAAATALSDLGAKTDAATTAALEANEPWEKVNATYERGRTKLIEYGRQMGLNLS
ncbi:hypothetical protein ACFWBT_26285, partial [Streptomyces sp. NPDC060027]